MSAITTLDEQQTAFLQPFLPATPTQTVGRLHEDRPYVTLTYACSLDGGISLAPGTRTTLSGPETKSMTHYLRLHHDAILVGAGTAVADNPSLNCRYPGVDLADQPRPIIIDPSLRWQSSNAAVTTLAEQKKGKKPWIVHSSQTADSSASENVDYISLESPSGSEIDWRTILKTLQHKGVNSIMIEGGATILNTLLIQPDLIDAVIVTIAPTWLGQDGVLVSPSAQHTNNLRRNAASLDGTVWKQFGADVVLCGRLRP